MASRPSPRRRLGWCYAANTAGGVLGCVLAAFYLLRVHDALVTTVVAPALNFAIAAGAFVLARRAAPPSAAGEPWVSEPSERARSAIYVATALSGMTALAAEVLWTRHISLLLGGTVYTFALILGVMLLGIGLGSAAGAAAGKHFDARGALASCQALLGVAMAAAAYALARSLPFWPIDAALPTTPTAALQLDLLRVAYVVLPSALLWGASFPLALAAAVRGGRGAAPRRRPVVRREHGRRDRGCAPDHVRARRRRGQPAHSAGQHADCREAPPRAASRRDPRR